MGKFILNEILKKKFLLIKSALTMVLLLCLIFSSFYLMSSNTFGWFSKNTVVSSSGMKVNANGFSIETKYYYKTKEMLDYAEFTNDINVFKDMFPGDTVWLKAEYTSSAEADYIADIYLSPGENGELPLETDLDKNGTHEYYYFGSQIKLSSVILNEGTPTQKETFIVPRGADWITHTSKIAVDDTEVALGLTIPANGSLVVEMSLEFINYKTIDQNVYQGFGSNGGNCSRQITTKFSDNK